MTKTHDRKRNRSSTGEDGADANAEEERIAYPHRSGARHQHPSKARNASSTADKHRLAIEALRRHRCLAFDYDGRPRLVEVHAIGLTRQDQAALSGYQVEGGSLSDPSLGWRLFLLDQSSHMALTDRPAQVPRPEYRRDWDALHEVEAAL